MQLFFAKNNQVQFVVLYRLCILVGIALACTPIIGAQYIIMLDPAGDAEHTGRRLEHNFERGLTLQCATLIQRELEQRSPHIHVVLTRTVGHKPGPLHHAQFANRLKVDLYIALSMYKEHGPRSVWSIYRFTYGQHIIKQQESFFIQYDQAYQVAWQQTEQMCQKLYAQLHGQASSGNFLSVSAPYALPHVALIGIERPALALEIGLVHDEDWQQCAMILVDVLQALYAP